MKKILTLIEIIFCLLGATVALANTPTIRCSDEVNYVVTFETNGFNPEADVAPSAVTIYRIVRGVGLQVQDTLGCLHQAQTWATAADIPKAGYFCYRLEGRRAASPFKVFLFDKDQFKQRTAVISHLAPLHSPAAITMSCKESR